MLMKKRLQPQVYTKVRLIIFVQKAVKISLIKNLRSLQQKKRNKLHPCLNIKKERIYLVHEHTTSVWFVENSNYHGDTHKSPFFMAYYLRPDYMVIVNFLFSQSCTRTSGIIILD